MEKKELNLKAQLVDLDGNPIKIDGKELTVSRALAMMLVNIKSSDPLRSYLLSQQIMKGENISEADKPFIREAVTSSSFTPLVTGQLLQLLS